MIKVNIICVGKIKEEFYRLAVAEYAKRLSRFCDFKIYEVAERKSLETEAEGILRLAKGYKIALCIEGEKKDSIAFAKLMKSLCDRGAEISFIIGSSCGLSDKVKSQSDYKLSFFGHDVSAPAHEGYFVGADLPRVYDKRRLGIS